jgi:hypothetical protein
MFVIITYVFLRIIKILNDPLVILSAFRLEVFIEINVDKTLLGTFLAGKLSHDVASKCGNLPKRKEKKTGIIIMNRCGIYNRKIV